MKSGTLIGGHLTNHHRDPSFVAAETQLGLLGTIIEGTSDGVMLLTPAVETCGPRIAFVNPSLCKITGLSRQELLAQPLEALGLSVTDAETYDTMMEQVFSGEQFWSETRIRTKDGEDVYVEISLMPVASMTSDISHWIGFVRDVSRQRREVQELAHRVRHDPVTGLANRTLLLERLTDVITQSTLHDEQFVVLVADLSGFQEVNDMLGYDTGDAILRWVGEQFTSTVRKSDVVARLGSDEFGFILRSTANSGHARQVATKIAASLRARSSMPARAKLGITIGAAVFPTHASTAGALLRCADLAMHEGRRSAQEFVLYDPDLEVDTKTRRSLAEQLSVALEIGQLIQHFQPIVDLSTGRTTRVEALVRWNHPTKGLIPPSAFLPVAESSGLMARMTSILTNDAMHHWSEWRRKGLDVRLSLNLSPSILHDAVISEMISEMLEKWDMPASHLELELTETSILSDPDRATAILSLIQGLGVTLALDDFGTGYSSLTNLRQIPFELIKIDRSFVTDMLDESGDAAIVRAIVDLGHALGRKVVAEGVEDQQTLSTLASWGCDYAQGYHISRPIPPDEVVGFVRAERR